MDWDGPCLTGTCIGNLVMSTVGKGIRTDSKQLGQAWGNY
jgi:hypothetical protein